MCYLRVGATIGWCGWYYNSVPSTMYQRKVDVDMLNAVKSVLADVSSLSPSKGCTDEGLTL